MQPKLPDPDGTREWLQQLERRVVELERIHAAAERRRRRSFWFMAVAVIVYVLLFLKLTSGF
ncbi:MAG: hypothetical protein ABL998_01035 [Planctomycetota bacterium]